MCRRGCRRGRRPCASVAQRVAEFQEIPRHGGAGAGGKPEGRHVSISETNFLRQHF